MYRLKSLFNPPSCNFITWSCMWKFLFARSPTGNDYLHFSGSAFQQDFFNGPLEQKFLKEFRSFGVPGTKWMFPKIIRYPKMDGENNGKPY